MAGSLGAKVDERKEQVKLLNSAYETLRDFCGDVMAQNSLGKDKTDLTKVINAMEQVAHVIDWEKLRF